MLKLPLFILAALTVIAPFSFANDTSTNNALTIELPDLDIRLLYANPSRLDHVLADTHQQLDSHHFSAPYWLGAQLIQPSLNEDVELLKTKTLEKLAYLATYYPAYALKADVIRFLLINGTFNHRFFIPLDHDFVRLQPSSNPMLEGDFALLIPQRTERVFVVGTIQSITSVEHKANQSPLDYLQEVALPEQSERDQVYVIQPDGNMSSFSDPYWQPRSMHLAPNSIIFSGFKSLPGGYAQLNEHIADLLRYMAPVQEGTYE